jgi:hypothetical protein
MLQGGERGKVNNYFEAIQVIDEGGDVQRTQSPHYNSIQDIVSPWGARRALFVCIKVTPLCPPRKDPPHRAKLTT